MTDKLTNQGPETLAARLTPDVLDAAHVAYERVLNFDAGKYPDWLTLRDAASDAMRAVLVAALTPEPVTPPPSAPADETQEQRLNRILNEPDLPVTILPDGTVARDRDADGRGLAVDITLEHVECLRHDTPMAGCWKCEAEQEGRRMPLSEDTVLTIRDRYTNNTAGTTATRAYVVSLCDSHEALRSELAALRHVHAACEKTINDAKGQEAAFLDRIGKLEAERDEWVAQASKLLCDLDSMSTALAEARR